MRAITSILIPDPRFPHGPGHRDYFVSGLRLTAGENIMIASRRLAEILAADAADSLSKASRNTETTRLSFDFESSALELAGGSGCQ
jgi:hypothetical protein